MDHRWWTMGDYSSFPIINHDSQSTGEPTTDWCSQGSTSAKINVSPDPKSYIGLRTLELGVGKTIKFKVDIKTKNPLKLCIYYSDGTTSNQKVDIPANSEGSFEVTTTIPDSASWAWYRIDTVTSGTSFIYYTDNWELLEL